MKDIIIEAAKRLCWHSLHCAVYTRGQLAAPGQILFVSGTALCWPNEKVKAPTTAYEKAFYDKSWGLPFACLWLQCTSQAFASIMSCVGMVARDGSVGLPIPWVPEIFPAWRRQNREQQVHVKWRGGRLRSGCRWWAIHKKSYKKLTARNLLRLRIIPRQDAEKQGDAQPEVSKHTHLDFS